MKRTLRWSRSVIRAWPFNNKIRLAALLIPKEPREKPIYEGVVDTQDDLKFQINTNSYIEYSVFTLGYYEKEVASIIRSVLKEGDVALDIGANVGIHTILMAKCVGDTGKVIAFEPLESIRKRLTKNLDLNNFKNVIIDQRALSNTIEEKEIFFDADRHNQGMFSLTWEFQNTNQKIQINKGDDVILEHGLERIDLIKMDIEGYEIFALDGLRRSIEKFKPAIIFEFSNYYHEQENKTLESDLINFLKNIGYTTFSIQPFGLKEVDLLSVGDTYSSNIYAKIEK